MKKIILLFFICIIPINTYASTCVMDIDSKRLLYGINENEVKLIASTTKILTALIVIENVDDLNKKVEIDESILKSYGSGIYIEVGEHIKIIDLLYGLMLRSGNDAAIFLANYVGGSMEGFSILMNEYASSIGMKNSHFINSSGLENEKGEGNTSTCYDMALLMSYASNNKTLSKIMQTKHHKLKTDYKSYDWHNKNRLLNMYKYTTGGKTGYTDKADRTLVTSASKNKKNLTVVTLDEENDFATHKRLYEDYFKKYKKVNVIDSKYYLKKEGLYVKDSYDLLLKDSEINDVKTNIVYTNDIKNRVGYVEVSLYDDVLYRGNIYIKEKNNTLTKIKSILIN